MFALNPHTINPFHLDYPSRGTVPPAVLLPGELQFLERWIAIRVPMDCNWTAIGPQLDRNHVTAVQRVGCRIAILIAQLALRSAFNCSLRSFFL